MSKRAGGSRDWEQRGRIGPKTEGVQDRAKRVQAILAARENARADDRLVRRGISVSTAQRYTTSANPTGWKPPGQSRLLTAAILDAIEDGQDRVLLAWPFAPLNGFAATALALREGRAAGRLAHASLGFWPWRTGATFAARSLLVHPGDIHQAAARAATDIRSGQAWALDALGHLSQCMLDLRLSDLKPASGGGGARSLLVRSPTLLETTSVFPPNASSEPYRSDPVQVLRRVREHTHMRDENASLAEHVAAVGDPLRAPFALFGLPAEARTHRLTRYLTASRFQAIGLDGVVIDATRNGRSELSDDWDGRLAVLLDALSVVPGRRPPVVVLVEDVFAMRKASKVLKVHAAAQHPRRRRAMDVGAYLPEPSPFEAAVDLGTTHPPVQFDVDIKDATLAPLREDLVALGRGLREAGHQTAASGVSQALALLRRSASLPIGLEEARQISDILYDADDEVDVGARSLFRPMMALAALAAVKDTAPEFGDTAARLVAAVKNKVGAWSEETPVSAKLAMVLKDPSWNSGDTLMAIGDRRVMEAFLGSDRAVVCLCAVTDHKGLRQELHERAYARLIVLGPTPDVVRTLLAAADCPERVLLLGDAAGSALVVAETVPVGQLAGFAPIAARAQALGAALARGGASERLDLAEAEFRIAATLPEGEIDFTQAGERYRGEIIQIHTQRGHRLAYRPNSDVLLSSPGEVRPFEKMQAREVKKGDRLLVLNAEVREPIRRAIAGSREALAQLQQYHTTTNRIYDQTPGGSVSDKARHMLEAMRVVDPTVAPGEVHNIKRWLTAGQAAGGPDGVRQPRAARDWRRFRTFMTAAGVAEPVAKLYWDAAVVPARSYRAQEGYYFNQRVVQFVRDPEGATVGGSAWASLPGLWRSVLNAVDEVTAVDRVQGERNG